MHEITVYIRKNIYDKELIKIEDMAFLCNKSSDHRNRYFKKEIGNTLKDHITAYQLNLIKTRHDYPVVILQFQNLPMR